MNFKQSNYRIKKQVSLSYDAAITAITEELKQEGFGVLTKIDVKQTLKAKIDADFTPYIILGACNPNLALEALAKEIDIGLLLPCNIIVYAHPESENTIVSAIDPLSMIQVTGRDDLMEFAETVRQKLSGALNRLPN